VELLTMHLGPDQLIIGARIDLSDEITGAEIEQLADRLDVGLAERLALIPHLFLDPTHGPAARLRPATRAADRRDDPIGRTADFEG
jgi:hypothetical protein